MFGEERGCIKLVDISTVKRTDEGIAKDEFQRMFEVNCVDGTHRIFLTETESQCDQWVLAIEQAMSNKFKSSNFVQNSSTGLLAKEESSAVKTDDYNALEDDQVTELKQAIDVDLGVHLITISNSITGLNLLFDLI